VTPEPKVKILNLALSDATKRVIPARFRGDPYICETSRLPHFIDKRLTDGGEVASLMRRLPLPPGRFLLPISVRG
jgi:hypothetical protein